MNKKLTKKIMAKNNLIKFSEFACFECILVYEKITFSNQHKLLFFNKPLPMTYFKTAKCFILYDFLYFLNSGKWFEISKFA